MCSTMWKSPDDMIDDLIKVNDSGFDDTKKFFNVLGSRGRGRTSSKVGIYIDSRTGEAINPNDYKTENFRGSRGRGSSTTWSSWNDFQTEIRMARPFGSSDTAIESYYRNRHETGDSSLDSPSEESKSDSLSIYSDSDSKNTSESIEKDPEQDNDDDSD